MTRLIKYKKCYIQHLPSEHIDKNYTISFNKTSLYNILIYLSIMDNTDSDFYSFKHDLGRNYIIFISGSMFKIIKDPDSNTCLYFVNEKLIMPIHESQLINDLNNLLQEDLTIQVEKLYKQYLISLYDSLKDVKFTLDDVCIVNKFIETFDSRINANKRDLEKIAYISNKLNGRNIVYVQYNIVNKDYFNHYIKELYTINNAPWEVINSLKTFQDDFQKGKKNNLSLYLKNVNVMLESSNIKIRFNKKVLKAFNSLNNILILMLTNANVSMLKDPIGQFLKFVFENLHQLFNKQNKSLFIICDKLQRHISENFIFTYLLRFLEDGDSTIWEKEYKHKSRLYNKNSDYFNNFLI
jgi:hypothetical protein